MRNVSYENLSNICKEIIRNKEPNNAINLIANIKTEDNTIIGKDTAKRIYKLYSKESVKYNSNKYSENITEYKKKVNKNIKKACGKQKSDDNNKFNVI